MKKSIYLFAFITLLLLGFTKQVSASHYAACDMTYVCLGGNDYEITLTFYRDCSGIAMPNNPAQITVEFSSSCNSFSANFPQIGPGVEVTPVCPGQVTTCGVPPGTLYGLQRYVYKKQITLAPCSNWVIKYDDCCRNPSNTLANATSQSWYIPATLNNQVAPCNSSPTFTNMPATVVCVGQPFCYNHGAVDPDGDSLVYQLIAPFQTATTNVNYMAGYSGSYPLPSSPPMTVDPISGDMCMTPTTAIIAVVGIRVQEWRRINGVPTLIGSILRDMQINIINICNNTIPTLAGINPDATAYNPADTNYTLDVCLGDTIAFNVYSYDASVPAQNLTMSWNGGIPAGTWSITGNGTPSPVGHFFWIPPASVVSNVAQCFTVNIKDDACPYVGQQTFSYCVTVKGIEVKLDPPMDSLLCMGESYQIQAHGDTNVVNYYWTVDGNPVTPINDTTFEINSTTLGPGMHIIGVKVDDGTATICPGYDKVTVNVIPQPDVNLGPDQVACDGQTVVLDAGPGHLYVWVPVSLNTQTINVTTTGIYSVTVDGGNYTRCQDTGSVYVRFLDVPTVDLGPDLCITAPTTLDAGYPGYEFIWSTGQNTQTIPVTSSGVYMVTVAEELGHGCDDIDTIKIALNPVPTLTIGGDTTMCSHHVFRLTARDVNGYLDDPDYVYTYFWPGSGEHTRSISLTCLPEGSNDIKLIVTGCTVVDTIRKVESKLCGLEMPNVITPGNTDGKNDRFEIKGIEAFPNSTMQIYNRWGKKIFESKNYNADTYWDGENAAAGVYYYVLTVNYGTENTCLEARNFNGTITIIR